MTHSTYNSSAFDIAVRGGHDSRTFFCVDGTGSIFIDTVDGDSVNTIHITIVCTAVSCKTAISSSKRVDGTSFITTLGLNKGYIYTYIIAITTSSTIYKEETHLLESIQCVTSHCYWQKLWIKTHAPPSPNARAVHLEVFTDGNQLRQVNAPSFVLQKGMNESDRAQTALSMKMSTTMKLIVTMMVFGAVRDTGGMRNCSKNGKNYKDGGKS